MTSSLAFFSRSFCEGRMVGLGLRGERERESLYRTYRQVVACDLRFVGRRVRYATWVVPVCVDDEWSCA